MNQPEKNYQKSSPSGDLLAANTNSIIKIQALFRGVLARRRVKRQHGFVAKTMSQANAYIYGFGEQNYDNQKVQEIKRQCGDFKYPTTLATAADGVNRET